MADEPTVMDDQRLTMFMTEVERVACENVRLRDLISYLLPFYWHFAQEGIDKCYFCRLDGSQWCDTHKGGCLIDEVIGDLRIMGPKLPYYSSNYSIKMRDQNRDYDTSWVSNWRRRWSVRNSDELQKLISALKESEVIDVTESDDE